MGKVICLVLLCSITCGSQDNAPASVKELDDYINRYINFKLKRDAVLMFNRAGETDLEKAQADEAGLPNF